MARTYTLKKRAEQQAETRLRIVDAAIDLHRSVGPARTTFSMVAERAGVQRHTLYAHFPDERSLLAACSGLDMERHPLPDPEPWRAIADVDKRLRTGLRAIYKWYEGNAEMAASVLRDAEHHAPTREVIAMRMGSTMAAYADILGAGLKAKQSAMLKLAPSFYTWRTLVVDAGLKSSAAADAMARAIRCEK